MNEIYSIEVKADIAKATAAINQLGNKIQETLDKAQEPHKVPLDTSKAQEAVNQLDDKLEEAGRPPALA